MLSATTLSSPMFLRVKRQFEYLALFALAGLLFLLLLRNREGSLYFSSSSDLNVTQAEGSHHVTEACQCSPCELQQPEPEVMKWDSSRVLRGPPTERFRGMLSRLMIQRV